MHRTTASGVGSGQPRRARGAVDVYTRNDGGFYVGGWILHPELAAERLSLAFDGVAAAECSPAPRADLANLFPHLPHAGKGGFNFHGPWDAHRSAPETLTITGHTRDGTAIVYETHRRAETVRTAPLPDERLRVRVAGSPSPAAFVQIGLDGAVDIMRTVAAHRPDQPPADALDWGCGTGRLTTWLLDGWSGCRVAGCDIDAEAIGWCNRHLRAGAFTTTGLFPPLPYADASFDVVVACSVMTHLEWSVQKRWLPEIRRILRPGGLFLASVHGCFAAAFSPGLADRVARKGVIANRHDKILGGIAPAGYYRGVFQSAVFTREHWGRFLPVIDYREGGLAGLQDLVVSRREG